MFAKLSPVEQKRLYALAEKLAARGDLPAPAPVVSLSAIRQQKRNRRAR